MAVKTIHIVPSDEAWIVKEPGRPAGSADVQKSHSRSDLGTKAIRDGVTAVIRERSAGTTKRAHRDARKGRFHRLARGGALTQTCLKRRMLRRIGAIVSRGYEYRRTMNL
jgi:hypothetical protein